MEQQAETTQGQEPKRFDELFEQFGEQMAAWGEAFGQRMAAWGEEFGRQMETWSKEFGPRMEAWSQDLAQSVEKTGERVGEWCKQETPSDATDASSSREGRLAILRMVGEGKISVDEAERLLRAMGE